MGKRGPIATPSALNDLKGNPGKRQTNKKEPKFDLTDKGKKPPMFLGADGKKEWKRILPLLEKNGLITDADYMALASYCQSVDTFIKAEKTKRAEGITTTTKNGVVIQHPAVGMANTALSYILKFGKEFGLTPASRCGVTAEEVEDNESPFMKLMEKAKKSG